MNWQPIETAPTRGDVLVFCEDSKEQFVAYWSKNPYTDDVAWTYARFTDSAGGRVSVLCRPSHWMPLPAPPEQVTEDHT